jgi:hypothetical protein
MGGRLGGGLCLKGVGITNQLRDVERDEMWAFVGIKEKAKGNLYKKRCRLPRRLYLRGN